MTKTEFKQKDKVTIKKCADYDIDCFDIEDKWFCYLYDPGQGVCPFIKTKREG